MRANAMVAAAAVAIAVSLSAAVAIEGYAQGTSSPAGPAPARGVVADQAIEVQRQTLDALIRLLEAEATAQGLQAATVRRHLDGLERDPEVANLASAQPEHDRTVGAYLALLVTPERVELGRQKLVEQAALLDRIVARWGLDRHILVALWGVETRYGAAPGTRPVVRVLATLAMEDQRRATFWRGELIQALKILVRGDVAPQAMLGSWAGAMGHTQFMPSTYNRFAVDFDGDGKRDIWTSAADGLASAANYLSHSGWQRGDIWGFEVTLPADFDYALSAPTTIRPASFWREHGVGLPGNGAWPTAPLLRSEAATTGSATSPPATSGDLRLILPAGATGPAFLVTRGFTAILRYNPSVAYALAVGHLADRLAGRADNLAPWPQEVALSRTERSELQALLARRGLDTGGVDGVIGSLTRSAIRSYQKELSLPQDGYASSALLIRLRAEDTK